MLSSPQLLARVSPRLRNDVDRPVPVPGAARIAATPAGPQPQRSAARERLAAASGDSL
ncbi:hypothetical protein [Kitasatospora sp. NPDC057015]|uniref:hypothetical protein n=1 Tax=Kitasatospora sp. NPDC057015 TaxID=3346001 RepID=UPI0036342602